MSIAKRVFNLTREQLEKSPTEVLDALLSLSPTPTADLSIDTVLIILNVIQERVGKATSSTLDAAWEGIKAEHLS